jgi:predicted O-methyltransferase YrrM
MYDIEKHRTTNWSVSKEEAGVLFSITKMINPKVIVEFGVLTGLTSANFLNALDRDASLYSYDLDRRDELNLIIKDRRYHFFQKDQRNFDRKDIDFKKIDLAYIDASHDFEANVETYLAIAPSLSEKSLIVTHDTSAFYGVPGEIQFASWLSKKHSRIDFHCDAKQKFGLSVFQIKSTCIEVKLL